MKIGIKREDLQDSIRRAIYEIDTKSQDKIIKKIIEENGYKRAEASDILNDNISFDTLSIIELGAIVNAIYYITEISYINPHIFFTNIELEEIEKFKKVYPENSTLEFPIVIENALYVADDQWITSMSIQKIAQMDRSNMIDYYFETQREHRTIKINGKDDSIIKAVTVNWDSVEEMKEELVKGLYIPNTITLNIKDFKYDEKNKRLIIFDTMTIPDGYHRKLMIISALRENPNLNYNMEVRFVNFDDNKAKRFIIQEDKRNPISKEYIKSINEGDLITSIVNKLNQDSTSELQGLITTDNKLIIDGIAIISFDMMYETIKQLWQPKLRGEADTIFEYLKDYFNKLISIYPNELKLHIQQSKKFNQINDERMFVLYLVIAKEFENYTQNYNLKNIIENTIATDEFKEYMTIPPSTIKRRTARYIKDIQQILEGVITNERAI